MASKVDWYEFYKTEVEPRLSVGAVYGDLPWRVRQGRQWRAPCPIHDGKNANFVVDTRKLTWYCYSKCQRGGGPLQYVNGGTTPRGSSFREVVSALAERVGVAPPDPNPRTRSFRVSVGRRKKKAAAGRRHEAFANAAARDTGLLLDTAVADQVWHDCTYLLDDAEAVECIRQWVDPAVDPVAIAELDLVRVLPEDARVPAELQPLVARNYRIVVRTYDATGSHRSFIGRPLHHVVSGPKSLAPRGLSRKGLVMAEPLARRVLSDTRPPSGWSYPPFNVLISEGERDFLADATLYSNSEEPAPAVLGIVSGSWTQEIADRMPDGTIFTIASDGDAAGERYAEQILRSLSERHRASKVEVLRCPRKP